MKREIIICNDGKLKDLVQDILGTSMFLEPHHLKKLKDKLKKEYDYNYPLSKYRLFDICIDSERQVVFLIIQAGFSPFEASEAVLDTFETYLLKDSISNVPRYNLLSLPEENQRTFISLFAAKENLVNFNLPTVGKKSKEKKNRISIVGTYLSSFNSKETKDIVRENKNLADENNRARTLAYLPTNILDSRKYVKYIEKTVKGIKGVRYKFYDVKALKKKKANLFLAVAQADLSQGCGIIKLTYSPKSNKKKKKICLIGKGVVYDSGGLDLKTDGGLEGMARDMTGSCVALGSFLSMIKNGYKEDLVCYLPILENKLSRDSYRNGDIVTTMDGTSVEVTDTDAEGRMALADSILLAQKDKPDLIITYATLTGTALEVTGKRMSVGFSNKKKLRSAMMEAGEISGERVWNLPILTDIRRKIRESELADINQSLNDEDCDHIVAAAFLDYFMGDTPFVHLDLASEYLENGLGLIDTKVTGFGIFFTNEFLKNFS